MGSDRADPFDSNCAAMNGGDTMKGYVLFVATVLGLGSVIFLAGCTEDSGWNTGFEGAPMNSMATPSDTYR